MSSSSVERSPRAPDKEGTQVHWLDLSLSFCFRPHSTAARMPSTAWALGPLKVVCGYSGNDHLVPKMVDLNLAHCPAANPLSNFGQGDLSYH